MESYKDGNKIMISVENLKDFKELIEKLDQEMQKVQKLVTKLETFDIEMKFDFK